jgi:hypothetical protein
MTICWNLDPLVREIQKKHKIKLDGLYNYYRFQNIKNFGVLIELCNNNTKEYDITILLKNSVVPKGDFPKYNFKECYRKLKLNTNYWITKNG